MFVMPFIVNFLQLKSIGGDDKDTQYYARKFDEKAKDQRKLYNVAKILIAIFQPFASLISMVATQIVLSSKKVRQNLGVIIGKYVSEKYVPLKLHEQTAEKDTKKQAKYGTNSEEDRTDNQPSQGQTCTDEEILFYYLGRVFIPVATIALLLVFISDCLLFSWYKNTTKKFLYLFPIPCIAISLFVINLFITGITAYCLRKEHANNSKVDMCILVYIFLVPVSGFPYLWFHGIWIFVALIIYPGRIIIGATFILPLLLVPIPLWNLCIEIYTYFKESEIKTAVSLLLCLFVSLIFWSLFIAILVIVSKLILDSNVNVPNDEDLFKSIFTFIFVNASSGIFLWLNRKLVYVVFNLTEKKSEDESR